jgi:hypothetical protein
MVAKGFKKRKVEEIRDGNYSAEAESVSSINQKNLAEMLEPHLAEKNHQKESKLLHPETPAHTKPLHATLL